MGGSTAMTSSVGGAGASASGSASTASIASQTSSTRAGATDAGADGAVGEAGAAATCGPPPARYTLITEADAGLVRDNATGLVWMRNSVGGGEPPQTQVLAASYCKARGMRLPTEAEAQALAANYAACGFGAWGTWTSTAADATDAWVVDYLGDVSPQVANNFPSAVLCVQDSATH